LKNLFASESKKGEGQERDTSWSARAGTPKSLGANMKGRSRGYSERNRRKARREEGQLNILRRGWGKVTQRSRSFPPIARMRRERRTINKERRKGKKRERWRERTPWRAAEKVRNKRLLSADALA